MTIIGAIDDKRERTTPDRRGVEPGPTWLARQLGRLRVLAGCDTATAAIEFAVAAPLLLGGFNAFGDRVITGRDLPIR